MGGPHPAWTRPRILENPADKAPGGISQVPHPERPVRAQKKREWGWGWGSQWPSLGVAGPFLPTSVRHPPGLPSVSLSSNLASLLTAHLCLTSEILLWEDKNRVAAVSSDSNRALTTSQGSPSHSCAAPRSGNSFLLPCSLLRPSPGPRPCPLKPTDHTRASLTQSLPVLVGTFTKDWQRPKDRV